MRRSPTESSAKPAPRYWRKISQGGLKATTSVMTLVEVASAMKKFGLTKDVSMEINAISSLIAEVQSIDIADVQESIALFNESGISLYDCVHAAVMKRLGISKIFSADTEFEKLQWIKRMDPLSILRLC